MLSQYGKKEWLLSGIISASLALILLISGAAYKSQILILFANVPLLIWICIAFFFRDPKRKIPEDSSLILSPADGTVYDISNEPSPFNPEQQFLRIGIFLSVLDVHINRMPVDLIVKEVKYKKGSFHDARTPSAAIENESNAIFCIGKANNFQFPLIIRQVAGKIARRIVSEATPGKSFKKGQKFGMIKFGSRTELYLPDSIHFELKVKVGDKVFAGSSVIAKIKEI